MSGDESGIPAGPGRRKRMETLLAKYPEVTGDELAALKGWFDREASPFEVASMASKHETKRGYLQFRVDHIDSIKGANLGLGILLVLLVLGTVALIVSLVT